MFAAFLPISQVVWLFAYLFFFRLFLSLPLSSVNDWQFLHLSSGASTLYAFNSAVFPVDISDKAIYYLLYLLLHLSLHPAVFCLVPFVNFLFTYVVTKELNKERGAWVLPPY